MELYRKHKLHITFLPWEKDSIIRRLVARLAHIATMCMFTANTEGIHGRYGNIHAPQTVSIDTMVYDKNGKATPRDFEDKYDRIDMLELKLTIEQELDDLERQVLSLIAQGKSNYDIGKEIHKGKEYVAKVKAKVLTMLRYTDTAISYIQEGRNKMKVKNVTSIDKELV
jgi:DNA-binding CsgD family transcriptional regulator